MTLILDLPPGVEAALAREARQRGTTPEALALDELQQRFAEMPPPADIEATLAALRERPVPQTLDDLKPRLSPPAGSNGMEFLVGQWPGDETDEEIAAALERLS